VLTEPAPLAAAPPRYTTLSLPPYRLVPGLNPHPHRNPRGHGFGSSKLPPGTWEAAQWRTLVGYLYAVDLYNQAYWWEAHEELEELWIAAGRTSVRAQFVQGLIQVAAANLNRHRGHDRAAAGQAARGLARLEGARRLQSVFMGVDIAAFASEVEAYFARTRPEPAAIVLVGC